MQKVAIVHKAAQVDLAKQLTLASGEIQKLKSRNAELGVRYDPNMCL